MKCFHGRFLYTIAGMKALPVSFYRRDGLVVARDLLGRQLCRRMDDGAILRGRIVEVEAYDGPEDQASHARFGPTKRNAPMFRAGGIAYVYLVYGMHHCMNVVTGKDGYPSAVLLRGVELEGEDQPARGPGRLTKVFRIDRSLDGEPLRNSSGLWIEPGEPVGDDKVGITPRVGIDYAGEWVDAPRRFIVESG
jgi:DNA-3-methyladenine glycosylase